MTINDEYIIEIFSNKNGHINTNMTRETWLNDHLEIKDYLYNRYPVFISYKFTLQAIFAHIEELPKCKNPNCNKVLDRIGKKYCSTYCQLTDPIFIAERDSKIDRAAAVEKFHKTCNERYGVPAPAKCKEIYQKVKDTNKKRYGCECVLSNAGIRSEISKTLFENYGVENPFQSEEIKLKGEQTKLERYGDPHYNNSEKQQETMQERYGVKSALCQGELREKGDQTKINKYGSIDNYYDYITEKGKQTKFERYGDANYNNMEKNAQTCNERYGVRSYSQTLEFLQKIKKNYLYEDTYFDSSWELALWIYAKDHNEEIERCPCSIDYYIEGELHKYFPDFKYKGKLLEVKGDQFFNADGSFKYNPEKYQCMIDNNVIIWKSKEIQFALDYVTSTYGKDYLSSFLVEEEVEDISQK